MPSGARKWLTPAAWVAAVSALLLLIFPLGFPNYDTIYALLWGREMAHGMSPDAGGALPPTPHPLAELFGLVTTPLGDGAIDLTMVVAYLSLALAGYLVYRLGSLWFDRPIGAVAALIVLTRAPYLSNGLRAYVDLPYIALVLGALVVETKRPRAGWPVLALLALAGLLRPEAWLFSLAYLAYLLLWPGGLSRARGVLISPHGAALVALALAAPVLWAIFDWITSGSPTYSFTGTRETVETLERQTGPVDLVLYGPRRLGEVLQWPGMIGAAGGIALGLTFLRRRSQTGVAAALLALGAFAVLACAGLAIIPRYTMLAAAVLAIFAALAMLGWRLLEPGASLASRLAGLRGLRRRPIRRLGPKPVRPPSSGGRRPHQPGRDRVRPRRPGGLRRLRAALPADLRPQPPGGAAPRLRPRRQAKPNRQLLRAAPAAPWLLPRTCVVVRDPQLHPRPQRPGPVHQHRSLPPSAASPATTPGSSTGTVRWHGGSSFRPSCSS